MKKTSKKRILSLVKLVSDRSYESVFDTCCDHGLIGLSLLNSKTHFKKLIFIDIVKHLIDNLQIYIADIPKHGMLIETKTLPVEEIKFEKSDLVIIAGVGGDLVLNAIKIHQKHSLRPKNYLISAHTKHLEVREELTKLGLKSVSEVLIKEDGIFYDHILLSYEEGETISPINLTGENEFLKEYYIKHAQILGMKAKYGNHSHDEILNIINNLMIFFK